MGGGVKSELPAAGCRTSLFTLCLTISQVLSIMKTVDLGLGQWEALLCASCCRIFRLAGEWEHR